MKKRILWLSSLVFFIATGSQGQTKLAEKVTKTGNEIVIPYEKYTLTNGLTLIVHEDHSDPIVHVDVTYHVGSAREQIGKSGFAHFFEHMMFQGSEHVADEQHFKVVYGAGGEMNGSTNNDRTNYYETVPSNQLEKMLWLESDRMGFLLDAVTQKKFEIQRSTVKNERGQRVDNVPYGLVSETYSKALYPYGHPYSWEVIGYLEDLNRSDVNDLKNFFLRWYGPNNATLTIGGDVKTADVVKLVDKYFGKIPSGPVVEPTRLLPPVLKKDRYVSYTDNYARQPRLYIEYPTVPDYHPDRAALACLAQVLGQGKNSVFYQQFTKKQLALNVTAFSGLSELAGEFEVRITPTPGKSLKEELALYRAALDSFEARGVTDDDIEKFKGSSISGLINGLQSVQGKVSRLAAYQTYTGNPNITADIVKMYQSLKKEDVMRVYNEFIKGKPAVILSVLTKTMDSSMVAAPDNFIVDPTGYKAPEYGYAGLKYEKARENMDRRTIPKEGPVPNVKTPKFWRKDLPNGIKMIGTENTEIPMVTITVTIPGGHLLQSNDKSKAGLARIFATMMGEDTKNYSAERMGVELQKLGSTLSVSSGVDGITFSIQSLKDKILPTLALVEERMMHPMFTEDAFSRNKKQMIEGFKNAKAQPSIVATSVFAKLNYGPNHILGISQGGTEETVKNITLKDVQSYFDNYMTSQGTRVVVVGDVKQEEILPKLAFLNKLPNKKIVLPKVDPAPAVDKTKVYMVDIPKSAQSEFRIGYATGMKYDATGDYYKTILMNYPLGGDGTARMFLNLREDKGWTYGAYTQLTGDKYGSTFQFYSGIRADATDSALAETMNIIKDYEEKGVSDEELTFMKNSLGLRDARSYETPLQKAAFIGRILNYNLPANYIEQQNKILANMTKQEMNAIAKRTLDPAKLNILLVGDKAKIYPGVKKLGYEIVELDVDGNKIEKKGF